MNQANPIWQWEPASPNHANFGNANQWTVNAGLHSLGRETAQNTNDAKLDDEKAELRYTLTRLVGDEREAFFQALGWETLESHLTAMGDNADAAVTASQIKAGVAEATSSPAILLLEIADYGCVGLTGPEMLANDLDPDHYGNFIKLCRTDLFSGKSQASGGSYGLGKAVYWRFSRLQTVLFNSVPVDGKGRGSRLFGVNQGVVHAAGGKRFEGRGFFGVPRTDPQFNAEVVESMWDRDDLAAGLRMAREDQRPGTTALLVGFFDPDAPERGMEGGADLVALAQDLLDGVEENFWPLLTRNRLDVQVKVVDAGQVILDKPANPSGAAFSELAQALKKYDAQDLSESLDEPGAIVVRDIPITISERIEAGKSHPSFVHTAKLVVTLSNDQPDGLENRVCLVRKPEMVVETIDKTFEGRTYHAFLLAGVAVDPDNPTDELNRADDFLRFAEPPAHDHWIPGSGRRQVAQTNLSGRYAAPWRPQLVAIHEEVMKALYALFDASPPSQGAIVESVLRHLKFLAGKNGNIGPGPGAARKPTIRIQHAEVQDGAWWVTFEIEAPNRGKDVEVRPRLRLAGLDNKGFPVDWAGDLEVVSGGKFKDGLIILPTVARARKLRAIVRGLSVNDMPIPAVESGIDVIPGGTKDSED